MTAKSPRTPTQILAELEEIERYFQASEIDLEQAIARHARAVELAKELSEILKKNEEAFKRISMKDVLGEGAGDLES